MSEINVRADAVDVEQIMRQIRARIREKRGTDYTEAEIEQLASVKLEKFLDPRGIRSDLVAQFRRHQQPQRINHPAPPNYAFEDQTLYETHRGILAGLRGLLRPILKLFFNPDKITAVLNVQAKVNTQTEQRLRPLEDWVNRYEEREPLFYEVIHNLTMEVTRLGIEVHNLKMRVESLSSRMDFDERRARALESVVEYRPHTSSRAPANHVSAHSAAPSPSPASARATVPVSTIATNVAAAANAMNAPAALPTTPPATAAPDGMAVPNGGDAPASGDKRRRRRRRRRRPGQTMGDAQVASGSQQPNGSGDDAADGPESSDADDGPDSSDPAGQ